MKNDKIQSINSNQKDLLADLGLNTSNNEQDSDILEYSEKLESLKKEIDSKSLVFSEELEKLNKIIDKNRYYEVFYSLELYNSINNKFFDKEYMTHPKIRFGKIKTFLEEIVYKFTPYLESISYKIKNEEDIEAYEKEYLCKDILSNFFHDNKKIEKIEPVNLKEMGANISNKSKLSDILRKIEDGVELNNQKEENSIKELSEYDKADLKQKIKIKYSEVYKRAVELDGEEDGLIKTYVEGLYNPETTKLDDKNLLLNLLLISKMQDFGIMSWVFDDSRVKVSNTEINLKNDWWNKILSEKIETDLKYVKIVEKDLNLAYYTSFFSSLIKNSDISSYGERNIKLKKILSKDGDSISTKLNLLLDNILNKTHEGSILFLTPDMEKHIDFGDVREELGNKGQLRYKGVWEKRHVFIINVEMIKGFEGYKNEITYVNSGNSFIINPEKPIVYFNVIENPFLDRPIIKWFAGADFDIRMDKAARIKIDKDFLD